MSSEAALERSDRTRGASDHDLVRAVRHGDDRAFEVLYSRYQRRIAAYVFGMVKDHGRAEDVTQEAFVAALRRMRQTERPIAFKPWIYEIAKNACIDAYRRGRRAEEVSFDARLSPADHGRLVATGPEPDAAVTAKQGIDHLRGAFGGLSDSHHQILVMREFEGRSYKDIGDRLGMSRPAVESTLFRARKRLGEEYDELASGARCLRIQAIIDGAQDARLGARETRKLARHVSHCQPCRRLAAHAGLDIPVPARRRVAGRIAAWLPLPGFLRLRRGGDDAVSTGAHANWLAQVPTLAEPLSSGWGKAAAGLAALALAGGGVGVTTSVGGDERGASDKPAAANAANGAEPAAAAGADGSRPGSSATRAIGTAQTAARTGAGSRPASGSGGSRGDGASGGAAGADASAPAGSGDGAGGGGGSADGSGGATGGGGSAGTRPGAVAPALEAPRVELPRAEVPATGTRPVQEAVDEVDDAARNAGSDVQQTVEEAVEEVGPAVPNPGSTVPDVPNAAGGAVRGAGAAAPGVSNAAGGAVQGAGAAAGGSVDGAASAVGSLPKP